MNNLKRQRFQKQDKDTLALISAVKQYLFSLGIRVDDQKAFDIFLIMNKLPYYVLIDRNESITYQGQGTHLTHKENSSQILVVKDIGRFELKAVKGNNTFTPKFRFIPSQDLQDLVKKEVRVNAE